MKALATLNEDSPPPLPSTSACAACLPFDLNLCPARSEAGVGLRPISEHRYPARRVIFRQRDLHDVVPFICSGWAASAMTLSDGSRQILSFLLPGDIVSVASLFGVTAKCSIEAITEVECRCYRREEFRAALMSNPFLMEKASGLLVDRMLRAQQLAVDLGRRLADERIARLILGLQERLAQRGMADGRTMEYRLRQHHVGDATGLTAVHVSKVLTQFRRRGLIEITDRSLTILDHDSFQRIANMR